MRHHDAEVLIVGAGPIGMTLANDLVMRGVETQIVDAMPRVLERAKAHGMWSRSAEQLDIAGLADPMVAARQFPLPGSALYKDGKMVRHQSWRANYVPHEPYPYSVFMPQHDTEIVLEAELERRGCKVQRNTRLVSFEQDAEGVSAVVETALDGTLGMYRAVLSGHGDVDSPEEGDGPTDSRTIRARWLIGCDGAHSRTRKLLGMTMDGETQPTDVVQTECGIDWMHPRYVNFSGWDGRGTARIMGIYHPFSDKWHMNYVDYGDLLPERPTLEDLQDAFRDATGVRDAVLREPKFIERVRSVNYRLPEHMVVGRVALAGDAAHARSALGGTGMSGGIQDAMNLGWKLALDVHGAAASTLMRTYEEEQRAEAVRLEKYVQAGAALRPGAVGARRGAAVTAAAGSRTAKEGTTVAGVLEDLARHLPESGRERLAVRAMLNVNHRGFSLTRQDPRPEAEPEAEPAPAPAPAGVGDPLTAGDALRLLTDGDALVGWLCEQDPRFAAHFRKRDEPVLAGDYLPDAVCCVAGKGTQLRHILRGPKANLLLFTGDEPTAAVDASMRTIERAVRRLGDWLRVRYVFPSESWSDHCGHPHDEESVLVDGQFEVREFLQVTEPEVIYVRPDGYLGLRTRDLDVHGVLDYLGLIYDATLLG